MDFTLSDEPIKDAWIVSVKGRIFNEFDDAVAYEGPSRAQALRVASEAQLFFKLIGSEQFSSHDIDEMLPLIARGAEHPFSWLARVFLNTGADSYSEEFSAHSLHSVQVVHFDRHGARRVATLALSESEALFLERPTALGGLRSGCGASCAWELLMDAARAFQAVGEREALSLECGAAFAPPRTRSI